MSRFRSTLAYNDDFKMSLSKQDCASVSKLAILLGRLGFYDAWDICEDLDYRASMAICETCHRTNCDCSCDWCEEHSDE